MYASACIVLNCNDQLHGSPVTKLFHRASQVSGEVGAGILYAVICWQVVHIMEVVALIIATFICYYKPYVQQHATVELIVMILENLH